MQVRVVTRIPTANPVQVVTRIASRQGARAWSALGSTDAREPATMATVKTEQVLEIVGQYERAFGVAQTEALLAPNWLGSATLLEAMGAAVQLGAPVTIDRAAELAGEAPFWEEEK